MRLSIRNSSNYPLKAQALELSSGWWKKGERSETISGGKSLEFEVSQC